MLCYNSGVKEKICSGLFLLLFIGPLMSSCADLNSKSLFDRAKDRLKLTDEQAVQVKPIFDEQIGKALALIKEERKEQPEGEFDLSKVLPASAEAALDPLVAVQALGRETGQKLLPILSARQLEEYDQLINAEIAKITAAQNEEKGGWHRSEYMR
jgi:hypothetical protein